MIPIYKYLQEEEIKKALSAELYQNNLGYCFNLLTEAWNSRFWEKHGYDGASVVQDEYHPRLANFLHDYMYRMGYGGYEADVIYRELLLKTGTKKRKAYTRFYAIRLAWNTYFKWKHKIKGNVHELTENILEVYLYSLNNQ